MRLWPAKKVETHGDIGHRAGSDLWAYGVRCAAEWAGRISPEAKAAILENLEEEMRFAAKPTNQ